MTSREWKLWAWDQLLGLDSKPTEFLTSLITFGIGMRIASGKSQTFQQLSDASEVVRHYMPGLGWALMVGAVVQVVGVALTVVHFVPLGRMLRWGSSVIDGAIWATFMVFMLGVIPLTDTLYIIYGAFLINDAWIVMGIAYRGYRGRASD